MGSASSAQIIDDNDTTEAQKVNNINSTLQTSHQEQSNQRSRTIEAEEENGAKIEYKETSEDKNDGESLNSNDSDDTLVLTSRMETYIAEKTNDDATNSNELEQFEGGRKDKNMSMTHDEIIEKIAKENKIDPNKIEYEIDTIGYYIVNCNEYNTQKGSTSPSKPIENEGDDNRKTNVCQDTTVDSKEVKNKRSENEKGSKEEIQVTEDRFEEFKRIYGKVMPARGRRKSVANHQTLVLAKVGSQYKYVAVPAYLQGQRLYKSSSFAKPYMERADGLYKVKKQKGKQHSFV